MSLNGSHKVDLAFNLGGGRVAHDHGYNLYAAICKLLPQLHASKDVGVHRIQGKHVDVPDGIPYLQLTVHSQLIIRLPVELVEDYISLAGATLEVGGDTITVGAPKVMELRPKSAVQSWCVVSKGCVDLERFETFIRRQLTELGIGGTVSPVPVKHGKHMGKPQSRAVWLREHKIIGWELVVEGLSATESLLLQEVGLGGRRRFGCGLFNPA